MVERFQYQNFMLEALVQMRLFILAKIAFVLMQGNTEKKIPKKSKNDWQKIEQKTEKKYDSKTEISTLGQKMTLLTSLPEKLHMSVEKKSGMRKIDRRGLSLIGDGNIRAKSVESLDCILFNFTTLTRQQKVFA